MLAWGSVYYLPAILAAPMAASFGRTPGWVFGAFSAALLLMTALGAPAGALVDRSGGRPVLASSSLVFAAGLALLAAAPDLMVLGVGWAVLGAGLAIGLYETAFAALAGTYGGAARGAITGVTLIGGFASTVGWPLSTVMLEHWGWRGACLGWAGLHVVVGLPLNWLALPGPVGRPKQAETSPAGADHPPGRTMALLGFAFAATSLVSAALAAHGPRLLTLTGLGLPQAVAAAALVGPAQVGARVLEAALFRRLHPLSSGRLACLLHPAGAAALGLAGAPFAAGFAVLHGIGTGMLTIARATLPLALFGSGGYGARSGVLAIPSRLAQAAAPLCFSWVIGRWGLGALWLTGGLSLASLAALLAVSLQRSTVR